MASSGSSQRRSSPIVRCCLICASFVCRLIRTYLAHFFHPPQEVFTYMILSRSDCGRQIYGSPGQQASPQKYDSIYFSGFTLVCGQFCVHLALCYSSIFSCKHWRFLVSLTLPCLLISFTRAVTGAFLADDTSDASGMLLCPTILDFELSQHGSQLVIWCRDTRLITVTSEHFDLAMSFIPQWLPSSSNNF